MKKKSFPYFISALMIIAAIIGGCAASVDLSKIDLANLRNMRPPNGKALVWVVRPHNMAGSVYTYTVLCNEKKIGKIANGRFIYTILDPDQYKFSVVGLNLDLSVQANQTYFIEFKNSKGLVMANETDGREKLNNTELSKDCRAYTAGK